MADHKKQELILILSEKNLFSLIKKNTQYNLLTMNGWIQWENKKINRISYLGVKNSRKVNKNFSSREFASIPTKLPSNSLLSDWFYVNCFHKDRYSKKKLLLITLRIKILKSCNNRFKKMNSPSRFFVSFYLYTKWIMHHAFSYL